MHEPEFHEMPPLAGGLEEFTRLIAENYPCAHNYFRGASKATYELIPSLGRLEEYQNACDHQKADIESSVLSRSYQARSPVGPACYNEIAAAIAAQHHGAPTRLLDWTDSPLIALFFATEPRVNHLGRLTPPDDDAAIWVKHECPTEYCIHGAPQNRSFELEIGTGQRFRDIDWSNGSSGFDPVILTPRISSQLGSFTMCERPEIDLRYQHSKSITDISKIVIPQNLISGIQEDLYRLGIRKRGIYPDEDGLNTSLVAERELDESLSNRCNPETTRGV